MEAFIVKTYAHDIVQILTKPLPKIYHNNVKDFLFDFWPDMPWEPAEAALVAREILQNEDLRHIVRAFDVKHNLDTYGASIEIGMMCYAMGNFDQ